MIKIFELEEEIKKIVEEATKDIKLMSRNFENEEDEEKDLTVFVGALPREELESIAPCGIVTTLKGSNSLSEKRLNTVISIAIYDTDTRRGYNQLYELLEVISTSLIEKGVLLEQFEILPEFEWSLPEIQPYPIHAIDIAFNILMRNDYRKDSNVWEEF